MLFQCCQHHLLYIFTSNEQEPERHTHKYLYQQGGRTVGVTKAETHHPLPHPAHIHRLVSINVQQAVMNVSGYHFFHMEEINDIPLLHILFSAAICHMATTCNGGMVQPLLPYHQHLPLLL